MVCTVGMVCTVEMWTWGLRELRGLRGVKWLKWLVYIVISFLHHGNRLYGVMGLLSKNLGYGWMGDTPSNVMTNRAHAVLMNWYTLGRDWLKEDFYKTSTQIMFEREFYYSLKLAGGMERKQTVTRGRSTLNSSNLYSIMMWWWYPNQPLDCNSQWQDFNSVTIDSETTPVSSQSELGNHKSGS